MSTDLISVVVVNWDGLDLLRACLNSLWNQSYKNFEIIIVNNALQELSHIINEFPLSLKILHNKKNFFYSFAQNQGIREAKGEYILSLNNDVVLENNFLREATRVMKMDEKIGIVSGKILSFDKKNLDSTGQFLTFSRKPLERGYRKKERGQFDKEEYIFGACGACALYRRKMLEEIKLEENEYFDCEYGLFYEDLDLNWRANLFGWKAYYTPLAIAYHLRGGSVRTSKSFFFKRFVFPNLLPEYKLMLLRNRYSTIIKNDTLRDFLRDFPFILIYDFSLWLYLLFFEPGVIIRFLKDLRFMKRAWEKRKKIWERRRSIAISV